jgi:hypothetical protein
MPAQQKVGISNVVACVGPPNPFISCWRIEQRSATKVLHPHITFVHCTKNFTAHNLIFGAVFAELIHSVNSAAGRLSRIFQQQGA